MNEENKIIIECLNKSGRVPEQWDLIKMINQLQSNWNSLREWLEKVVKLTANIDEKMTCKNVLDKMNKLEGKDNK